MIATEPVKTRTSNVVRSVEWLVLGILATVFLCRGFIPGWRSLNSDFPNYYIAARLYRQGYPLDRMYDWIWFQRQADHAGLQRTLVSYIPLTPFSLLPVLPLASLPAMGAKHCWLMFNLVALFLTGFLLNSITTLGARRVALLTLLAVLPLRTNFLLGQEHLLILLLLAVSLRLYLGKWPAASGATLALAGALKIYPILFLIYFAFKRQWRAAAGLVAGSVALGLLSWQLFGFETLRVYFVDVLPRPLRGEGIDPYSTGVQSFTALLHRLFIAEPVLNPHPLLHAPALYAFLQPLCQGLLFVPALYLLGCSKDDPHREKLAWGSYAALLLILSSNPASYHYCVLILTAVLSMDYVLRARGLRPALTLVAFYLLTCLPLEHFGPKSPSGWMSLLAFPRLYAFTIWWILLCSELARSRARSIGWRTHSRAALVFGVLFVVLVGTGVKTNLRYLDGQFTNYETRLISMPVSTLAGEPATAGGHVVFTTLAYEDDPRYLTGDWTNGSLRYLSSKADIFHPVLTPDLSDGWVELASGNSRITRFSLDRFAVTDGQTEIENAEEPVASLDGKWLAFIREQQGRGALSVISLAENARSGLTEHREEQLVDSAYDVRDAAFFPDGRMIVAAQLGRTAGLFLVDRASRTVTLMSLSVRARHPAVSPDGEWLAYDQEESGNRQLWLRSLSTGDRHRLTSTACNSVTPVWLSDSETLIYATDCGRGLGLTALCKIQAIP